MNIVDAVNPSYCPSKEEGCCTDNSCGWGSECDRDGCKEGWYYSWDGSIFSCGKCNECPAGETSSYGSKYYEISDGSGRTNCFCEKERNQPGCKSCDVKGDCSLCGDGTYLQGGNCVACSGNQVAPRGSTSSSACLPKKSSGSCQNNFECIGSCNGNGFCCNAAGDSCETCDISDGMCKKCRSSADYLSSGQCLSCTSPLHVGESYTRNSDQCDCASGYEVQHGDCIAKASKQDDIDEDDDNYCITGFTGLTCSDKITCGIDAAGINSNLLGCYECDPYSDVNCAVCRPGYYMTTVEGGGAPFADQKNGERFIWVLIFLNPTPFA